MDELKSKRRLVSDEEYARALADRDNRGVIHGVTRQFAGQLDPDELESCSMNGLWRALQYHRDGYNKKFTTSLHMFVVWECRRELKRKKKLTQVPAGYRPPDRVSSEQEILQVEEEEHVRNRLRLLPGVMRSMVEDYLFGKMTARAIGEKYGCGKESARTRIRHGMQMLSDACNLGMSPKE